MAKTRYKSVDDYIAAQPLVNQAVLIRVRAIISKALPKAQEVISYQIPAYRQFGRPVIFFAAWKEHYSIYPATGNAVAVLKEELSGYEVSKGTIRFSLSKRVPARLIQRFARLRAQEAAEQTANAKAPKLLRRRHKQARKIASRVVRKAV